MEQPDQPGQTGRIFGRRASVQGELYPHAESDVKDRYWLHALLFLATLISTIIAGGQMAGRYDFYAASENWISLFGSRISVEFLLDGLRYGASLLLFLGVHEFGHYFAARKHNVSTSLPYFIPFPWNGIGTFGAIIRIREQIPSMKKLFDIGTAGPMAGFVVALGVLIFGLATLPSLDYVADLYEHQALKDYVLEFGAFPKSLDEVSVGAGEYLLVVGQTPLYWLLTQFFTDVPPMWEMYHYPVLFAGWLGLFFTAVNLLPVGQLDGGHMLYALVGPKWHRRLARGFVLILLISGGVGFIDDIGPMMSEWTSVAGFPSWLILAFVLLFYLQKIFKDEPRLIVGWLFGVIAIIAVLRWSPWMVEQIGYTGWLIWTLLIVLLIRVDHPPVLQMEPLTSRRKILAIFGLVIFALSFSIKPLYII
ncbi:MAG: site-2 protease family protein [Rhodothermia bacterium]|nr:MAG: site-2 protease family protein [Rhodothermia bacterium]